MFPMMGIIGGMGIPETDPAVGAWPFHLGIAFWILVVLIHGWARVRKEDRPGPG